MKLCSCDAVELYLCTLVLFLNQFADYDDAHLLMNLQELLLPTERSRASLLVRCRL